MLWIVFHLMFCLVITEFWATVKVLSFTWECGVWSGVGLCAVVWCSRWAFTAVQRCRGWLCIRTVFTVSRQQHVRWQHEFWIRAEVHLSSWTAWWQLRWMYASAVRCLRTHWLLISESQHPPSVLKNTLEYALCRDVHPCHRTTS